MATQSEEKWGITINANYENPVSDELAKELDAKDCEGPPVGVEETAAASAAECQWIGRCKYCKGSDGKWYQQYCV